MWLKELFEAKNDSIVFAFGRYNPPTLGHEAVFQTVLNTARSKGADHAIFISSTQKPKTDPLSFQYKLDYLQRTYTGIKFNGDDTIKTIVQLLQELMNRGYRNITMVAGSDRVTEFRTFLNQYNKKPDKKGNIPFEFDSIDVVSSGERDPDQEGVSGISASGARAAATAGDQKSFMRMVNPKFAVELYKELKKSMGVKEQVATNTEKLYNQAMPEQANGKPTVYLDMDGVIADFFGGVEKLYGVSHWKQLASDKTKDLRQDVIDRITGTNFFETLPKFPTADTLISMIKKYTGGKFTILTSPLRGDHDNSARWKRAWINQNIETPNETIVTGRKEKYATTNGTANILIDDRPINIQKWQDKGGYGILYQANKDSLNKIEQSLKNYGGKNGY
jgi:hypothetical protein